MINLDKVAKFHNHCDLERFFALQNVQFIAQQLIGLLIKEDKSFLACATVRNSLILAGHATCKKLI